MGEEIEYETYVNDKMGINKYKKDFQISRKEKNYIPQSTMSSTSTQINRTQADPVARTSSIERRYEELLRTIDPVRGGAIVLLGGYLYKKSEISSKIASIEFAKDLLEFESNEMLEVLKSLLNDGWSGSVGELLQCSRSV